MDQEQYPPQSSDTQATPLPPLDAKGLARRRFTRAGAGATGVILTLQSQPAMATYGKCVSPSGFTSLSMGTSLNPLRSCLSNEDPQYWENNRTRWNSRAFANPDVKFIKVFNCPGSYSGLANISLYDVLAREKQSVKNADPSGISRLCIAAWLNARVTQQGNPVLSPERVVDIWNQYAGKGSFTPGPKMKPWSRTTIFDYLRTTFRTNGY